DRRIHAAAELPFGSGPDHIHFGFVRRRARKIFIRPAHEAADFLEIGKGLVRARDDSSGRCAIPQKQDRARLGISATRNTEDHAVAHLGLTTQGLLQIFRIYLETRRSDDYVLAASFEVKIALLVQSAKIAGAEPTFFSSNRLQLLTLPVLARHVGAADKNFSGFRIEFHLATGQDLAD